jgi:hypothetical protein
MVLKYDLDLSFPTAVIITFNKICNYDVPG